MAAIKNVMEKIELSSLKVNPRYDATPQNLIEIERNSPTIFEAMVNSFYFGYLQGGKAAVAEMKGAKR